jgi:circadian clock protein KaiC
MKPGRTSPVNVPLADDKIAIDERVPTGICGLDEILGGGLPAQRVYLLEGDHGTGKTTIALQFLLDGVARGETCLYMSLSETASELRAVARSHGWSLDGLLIHELTPSEGLLGPDSQYSLFHPSEVELSDTIKGVIEQVSRRDTVLGTSDPPRFDWSRCRNRDWG